MRRKSLTAVVSLTFVFTVYAASCDGGGSLDCGKLCEKSKECSGPTCVQECEKVCATYADADAAKACSDACPGQCDDFDMKACTDGCENSRDLVQEDFQDAMMSCIEEECANQEACINEAAKECEKPDSFDGFIDVFCTKFAECNPTYSVAQCQALAGQAMAQEGAAVANCLTDSALETMSDCVGGAACETFDDDFEKCFSEAFGFEIGGSGSSSTDGGM